MSRFLFLSVVYAIDLIGTVFGSEFYVSLGSLLEMHCVCCVWYNVGGIVSLPIL
jgi:hypothetical protein